MSTIKTDNIVNRTGDQDSGLDLGTNDVVKVKIAGSEKVRVHSDGNVGIGTTSPAADLTIKTASNEEDVILFEQSDGTDIGAIRIHGGAFKFQGKSATAPVQLQTHDGNEDIEVDPDGFIKMESAGSERMRIDSSGTTSFHGLNGRCTTSTGHLSISDQSNNRSYLETGTTSTGSMNLMVFVNPNGVLGAVNVSSSTCAFNNLSDYRAKENVTYSWDATSRLKQLKPARFNFKADKDTTMDGFLAHEVSVAVPIAVTGEKDAVEVWEKEEKLPDGVSVGDNKLDEDGNTIPVMQAIDHSKLVPLLVKTIQELEARVAALEAK